MLKLESIFLATSANQNSLFKKLGFTLSPSDIDSKNQHIFFGPETIELTDTSHASEILGSTGNAQGVLGLSLESDSISEDFDRIQKAKGGIKKFQQGLSESGEPRWIGVPLTEGSTPLVKGWMLMRSPHAIQKLVFDQAPHRHENTCWGIEGVHFLTSNTELAARGWAEILGLPVASMKWNECFQSQGHRIRTGERFMDFVDASTAENYTSKFNEQPFMLTLQVTDLEELKSILTKNGVESQPCRTRDGLLVDLKSEGLPLIRFVRQSWKKFAPVPERGRREDHYRSLGGVYVSTLKPGF